MAKVELKVYDCLCVPDVFRINDKEAYSEDFGIQQDLNPELDDSGYGCGNMQFSSYEACSEKGMAAIKKYNLTVDEYHEVCSMLENKLSFGYCD